MADLLAHSETADYGRTYEAAITASGLSYSRLSSLKFEGARDVSDRRRHREQLDRASKPVPTAIDRLADPRPPSLEGCAIEESEGLCFLGGDQESSETYPAEKFQSLAEGPCDVEIMPDCDHFYVGREDAVTEIVAPWLKRTFAL
jgi:hypothetical protein